MSPAATMTPVIKRDSIAMSKWDMTVESRTLQWSRIYSYEPCCHHDNQGDARAETKKEYFVRVREERSPVNNETIHTFSSLCWQLLDALVRCSGSSQAATASALSCGNSNETKKPKKDFERKSNPFGSAKSQTQSFWLCQVSNPVIPPGKHSLKHSWLKLPSNFASACHGSHKISLIAQTLLQCCRWLGFAFGSCWGDGHGVSCMELNLYSTHVRVHTHRVHGDV
jgi:hypothetical protein